MWFHKVEPSPIGECKREGDFGSLQRSFLTEQFGNGKDCPLQERVLSTSWLSDLEGKSLHCVDWAKGSL